MFSMCMVLTLMPKANAQDIHSLSTVEYEVSEYDVAIESEKTRTYLNLMDNTEQTAQKFRKS